MTAGTRIRFLAAIAVVVTLVAAYRLLEVTGELDRILYAVLALGQLTLVPLAVHMVRERRRDPAA